MLKNKFGMTKVLVLVLSVLMLVSLAACKKEEGPSSEDMNALIQSALAEQSKAQASQDAALQSSLKAEQDALASKNAALESSLKAEQDKLEQDLGKVSSKADATTAATTPKATTTPKQTTTKAPEAKEDITAQIEELSALKTKYTYTDKGLYLDAGYAELVLLFDKASVDMTNATTVKAATQILETLKVDVAAVENVKIAAAAVQAQIAELGDIETEVFLAQAEKITAARKAYTALKTKYNSYLKYDKDKKADGADTVKIATKLGVNVADLVKAENKLDALEDYITYTLQADMQVIYDADARMKYDAEDDFGKVSYSAAIEDAYYKYLVLNVINGGDTAAANLPIDWEYKYDEEGKVKTDANGDKIYDKTKPTAWFTVESLVETYILPTLDVKFVAVKAAAVETLAANLGQARYDAIAAKVNNIPGMAADKAVKAIAKYDDVKDVFEDAVDAFETELEALSFVADYKGNVTFDKATADVYTRYMKAYVSAVNGIIALSQEFAIETYTDDVYDENVKTLEKNYADDKYETVLANKLAAEATTLETFIANVNAAPSYDFDAINAEEVRVAHSADKKNPVKTLTKYIDVTKEVIVADAFYNYVDKVIYSAINNNFKTRIVTASDDGVLGTVQVVLIQDLETLAAELDAAEDGALWKEFKGEELLYPEDTNKNDAAIATLLASVNSTIEAINAIKTEDYTDKEQAIIYTETTSGTYKSWSKKALYIKDADAYKYVTETAKDKYINADGTWNESALNSDRSTLLTVTATDYPLTYTYTAAEQASKAAYDAYLAVLKDVHAKLLSIAGTEAKYTKLVTDSDAYKAIVKNVSSEATLSTEVADIAAVYTKAITDLTALKKTVAEPSVVSTNWYITKTHVSIKTLDTAYALNTSENYVKAAVAGDETLGVDSFAALADLMNDEVAKFETLFYADADKKVSNVVELWKYKNEKVQTITATLNNYQNKYKTEENGTITETKATAGYAYVGVDAGVKLSKATAYEDALNKLIADYTTTIMGVKLNTLVDVKTAITEDVIFSKTDKTASLDNAKAIVDAYVTKLLTGTKQYTVSDTADSAAYQAFKLYYLGNYDALIAK